MIGFIRNRGVRSFCILHSTTLKLGLGSDINARRTWQRCTQLSEVAAARWRPACGNRSVSVGSYRMLASPLGPRVVLPQTGCVGAPGVPVARVVTGSE